MKTTLIRVETADLEKARTLGKERLLSDQPQMKGMVISDRFMFKRMVNYFISE